MTSRESADVPNTGGGLTLFDLGLMLSGGWALPAAVEATRAAQGWRVAAYILGGAGGLFWGWYCKKFEWHAYRLFRQYAYLTETRGTVSTYFFAGLYVATFTISLIAQYGIYVVLRVALVAVLGSR